MKFVYHWLLIPAHSFAEIIAHCLDPGGVLDQKTSLQFIVTLHLHAHIVDLILAILKTRNLLTSSSSNRIHLYFI